MNPETQSTSSFRCALPRPSIEISANLKSRLWRFVAIQEFGDKIRRSSSAFLHPAHVSPSSSALNIPSERALISAPDQLNNSQSTTAKFEACDLELKLFPDPFLDVIEIRPEISLSSIILSPTLVQTTRQAAAEAAPTITRLRAASDSATQIVTDSSTLTPLVFAVSPRAQADHHVTPDPTPASVASTSMSSSRGEEGLLLDETFRPSSPATFSAPSSHGPDLYAHRQASEVPRMSIFDISLRLQWQMHSLVSLSCCTKKRGIPTIATPKNLTGPAVRSGRASALRPRLEAAYFVWNAALFIWAFVLAVQDLSAPSPSFLAVALLAMLTTMTSFLFFVDRTLLRLCISDFETKYLMFSLVLFVSMGSWSQSSLAHWTFTFGYFGVITCMSLLIFFDCFPTTSRRAVRVKAACTCFAICMYVRSIVVDQAFRSEYAEYTAYFFYQSTSRHLALVGCGQLLLFSVKYLVQDIINDQRTFVHIRLPVQITQSLGSASCSSISPSDTLSSPHPAADSSAGDLTVRTEDILQFVQGTSNQGSSVVYTVPVAPGAARRISHTFQFRPCVTHPIWHRVASATWYKCAFVLYSLTGIAASIFFPPTEEFSLMSWMLLLCSLCILSVEATRFDRSLLHALLFRFEWWLLFGSSIQYTVFTLIQENAALVWYENIPFPFLFILLTLFFISFDAAPAYSKSLKITFSSLYLLNAISILVQDVLQFSSSWVVEPVPVCFYFCADANQMRLSALVTLVAFQIKYLLTLWHHPRCIILYTQLLYGLKRSLKNPASSAHREIFSIPHRDHMRSATL